MQERFEAMLERGGTESKTKIAGRLESVTWFQANPTTRFDFSKVACLLGIGNMDVRRAFHGILASEGIGTIVAATDPAEIAKLIGSRDPDLIVFDSSFGDKVCIDAIKAIRHHKLGVNPFVVIVALVESPERERVVKWIDAGADDLISHPIVPARILGRLGKLATLRKPFIITSTYIGPDRRNRRNLDVDKDRPVVVPNTFGAKACGTYNRVDVERKIAAAQEIINGMKVRRHGEHLRDLGRSAIAMLREGMVGSILSGELAELGRLAYDISVRLEPGRQEEASLCGTVCTLVHLLDVREPKPDHVARLQAAVTDLTGRILPPEG